MKEGESVFFEHGIYDSPEEADHAAEVAAIASLEKIYHGLDDVLGDLINEELLLYKERK